VTVRKGEDVNVPNDAVASEAVGKELDDTLTRDVMVCPVPDGDRLGRLADPVALRDRVRVPEGDEETLPILRVTIELGDSVALVVSVKGVGVSLPDPDTEAD